MRSSLLIFLACTIGWNAQASLNNDFYNGFKAALIALEDLNIGVLGMNKDHQNIPVSTDLVDQITYREVPNLGKPTGATRRTAFASCDNGEVLINRAAINNGPVPLPIIIHESLGALCIVDPNYEFSTVLALLIEENNSNLFQERDHMKKLLNISKEFLRKGPAYKHRFIETLPEQNKILVANSSADDGTATLIGSAGDEVSAQIKYLFLKSYLDTLHPEWPNFEKEVIRAFLNVRIERKSSDSEFIRYVRQRSSKSLFEEKFYFYVPLEMPPQKAAEKISMFMARGLIYGPNFRSSGYITRIKD